MRYVVVDTTKVRIFKQITTRMRKNRHCQRLLLIPQRYEFSSKSQLVLVLMVLKCSCCWYHKGTNFQANHNKCLSLVLVRHVVVDTTKVRIFKQITTDTCRELWKYGLLLIPQRYEFSSKSQLRVLCKVQACRCCWYHKGTNFQANHNSTRRILLTAVVVVDTTKVRIFKQITTPLGMSFDTYELLLIPQRYEFSSKSQLLCVKRHWFVGCCWYHKGTNFQANHNRVSRIWTGLTVVVDTTKVRIFKQITTKQRHRC